MKTIDAQFVRDNAITADLVRHLENTLRDGFDPEVDRPRLFSPIPGGEFLVMPSSAGKYCGTKILTLAPDNPSVGRPKVQGVFILFDLETMAPLAAIDGTELTLARTSAVTTLVLSHLLRARFGAHRQRPAVDHVVVFGTGPQARRHIHALDAIADIQDVIVVGRCVERAKQFVDSFPANGRLRAGVAQDVQLADVVLCVTSSNTPIFDEKLIQEHAVVAAIGSHGLNAREVEPNLVRRSQVFVEAFSSAMREGGNLIPARSREEWEHITPTTLADLARGDYTVGPGPLYYNGIGMSWEDTVIGSYFYERTNARTV